MTGLTIILTPEGIAEGVVAALCDLSAADLVDPFLWVVNPNPSAGPMLFKRVSQGRMFDVTLQEVIAVEQADLLRVCVLVPLVGDIPPLTLEQERATAETLGVSLRPARTVRVRLLLPRPGTHLPPTARVAVDGWHNIVIAPEDGRGPGLGAVRLGAQVTTAEVGRHAAPVVAGVMGLWSRLDHAPIDAAAVVPGEVIRLARSFYRKLDTGEAEQDLRAQLLSQDGTLPLPSDARSPVVYVNDVPLATQSMSDAFWRKHAGVLRGPRRNPEQAAARQQVGARQALAQFISFMWAAIKNAPGAWYQAMVNSVSAGIAGTINRTVFGGVDSAYEVVFNGRTPRGELAGWLEIGTASGQLSGALADSNDTTRHNARVDLSGVWQDYARAAMTLGDAGARSTDLPPVQIGVNRGIIVTSADIVPGPADRFTDVPGIIAASVQIDSVDATDPLGTDDLRDRLRELEREKPDQALPARETLTALQGWRDKHDGSFGVLVGRRIGDAFATTFAEVKQLLRDLATPTNLPSEPDDGNKKLARWVQITTVLMLVVAGAAIWLVVERKAQWYWALAIVLIIYLISFLLIFRAYYTAQRELFHLLHRRRTILDKRAVDEDNLRSALRDLNRLAQAYGEYLAWSRALGAFLAAPLGPDSQRRRQLLQIRWGLPLSTAIGYATPDAREIDTTVGYLRRDLFNLGWLSGSWEQLVAAAVPLAPGGRERKADDSPLWPQPGRDSGSALDRWSTALFTGAVTSTGADVKWREALHKLTGSLGQLTDSFVNRVQQPGGPPVTAREFFSQIDTPAPPPGTDEFDGGLLSDFAVTRGSAKVVEDHRKRVQDGVGTICVATQFSDSFPIDFLRDGNADPSIPAYGQSDAAPANRYQPPTLGDGFKF
ncbi:hypothetical protein FK535_06980 [Mycolicibacterium sp. 018/SC-01/001]|uniref:hypothetical protein n=1 Tax=Mycolicibacterium sp. 018/SC-01/001 TaxID=2592069 RepID=UPI00117DAEAC|nr:hypothetical protein [Mycolicibacterium sp. 018/SC-01/001]TRW86209.1 hypothetical protein FK535_06980 [Mycolicibacterium sp. 018/SC-01/001]